MDLLTDAIDRLAAVVDPRTTMLVLAAEGVVTRPLSDPTPQPREGRGWSAHAPLSGESSESRG